MSSFLCAGAKREPRFVDSPRNSAPNTPVNRRQLLAGATAVASATAVSRTFGQPRPARATATTTRSAGGADAVPDDLVWRDVREWGVEGRGFDDTESYFDRLPARAKDVVRKAVWDLSRDSTGMSAHFEADADAIYVRYTLAKPRLEMAHMPATGVSGVDLYGRLGDRWQWVGVTKPTSETVTAP